MLKKLRKCLWRFAEGLRKRLREMEMDEQESYRKALKSIALQDPFKCHILSILALLNILPLILTTIPELLNMYTNRDEFRDLVA